MTRQNFVSALCCWMRVWGWRSTSLSPGMISGLGSEPHSSSYRYSLTWLASWQQDLPHQYSWSRRILFFPYAKGNDLNILLCTDWLVFQWPRLYPRVFVPQSFSPVLLWVLKSMPLFKWGVTTLPPKNNKSKTENKTKKKRSHPALTWLLNAAQRRFSVLYFWYWWLLNYKARFSLKKNVACISYSFSRYFLQQFFLKFTIFLYCLIITTAFFW